MIHKAVFIAPPHTPLFLCVFTIISHPIPGFVHAPRYHVAFRWTPLPCEPLWVLLNRAVTAGTLMRRKLRLPLLAMPQELRDALPGAPSVVVPKLKRFRRSPQIGFLLLAESTNRQMKVAPLSLYRHVLGKGNERRVLLLHQIPLTTAAPLCSVFISGYPRDLEDMTPSVTVKPV